MALAVEVSVVSALKVRGSQDFPDCNIQQIVRTEISHAGAESVTQRFSWLFSSFQLCCFSCVVRDAPDLQRDVPSINALT